MLETKELLAQLSYFLETHPEALLMDVMAQLDLTEEEAMAAIALVGTMWRLEVEEEEEDA